MYHAIKWHSQDLIAKHSQGDKFSCLELCDCLIKGKNFIYVRVQMQLYRFGVLWKPLGERIAVTGLRAQLTVFTSGDGGWGPQTFEVAWKDVRWTESAGMCQSFWKHSWGQVQKGHFKQGFRKWYQSLLSGSQFPRRPVGKLKPLKIVQNKELKTEDGEINNVIFYCQSQNLYRSQYIQYLLFNYLTF